MAGGGGKSGQTSTSQSKALDALVSEFAATSRPARQELFGQVTEALRTGGVGARIPIISKAVEASKAATSNALRQIETSLARSGLAGTPFGARITAGEQMRGALTTANIPTNIAQQLISFAPNLVTATGQTVMAGAGSANQTRAAQEASNAQIQASILTSLIGAGGQVGTGIALGGGGCWIAAVLYGEGSIEFTFARQWIFSDWKGPVAATVRWIYRRVGRRLAPIIDKSDWLKACIRPLFDRAVSRGRAAWQQRYYQA